MKNRSIHTIVIFVFISLGFGACKVPQNTTKNDTKAIPEKFSMESDSINSAEIKWKSYFEDSNLIALIDTALKNNQELNIVLQEVEISRNEIRARKGEYIPFVNAGLGAGFDKSGRYTRYGALEDQLEINPGNKFPEPLQDYSFGAVATWEIDIWNKLHNAKKSAVSNYLASIDGKNFMVTNLIAEISESYFELMALDNMLDIIEKNIGIQSSALKVVKQQKDAAKVTQLAVNRFEAQLLNTKNLQFEVKQKIIETENHINYLTGRFPNPIPRNSSQFLNLNVHSIKAGLPSQLLVNRPDIRQAENVLMASKLNVKAARANFYPSFGIKTGVGFQAFKPNFLVKPESMLYNLTGDLIAPLINRNAIKAAYKTASAQQVQAVYNYQKTILNAYVDVLNQLAKIDNFSNSYDMKFKEVEILKQSINIANSLFNSARADYTEVLLTQREALESKMEIIEIKMKLLNADINVYRALGGGWN